MRNALEISGCIVSLTNANSAHQDTGLTVNFSVRKLIVPIKLFVHGVFRTGRVLGLSIVEKKLILELNSTRVLGTVIVILDIPYGMVNAR